MSKIRYAFPKYRVFIFGHEVTKDVVSINVTSHDGEAPNICQLELINELDKYIITTADLVQLTQAGTPSSKLHIPWLDDAGVGSTGDIEVTRSSALSPGDADFMERLNSVALHEDKKVILERKNLAARSGITPSDKVGAAGSLDESLAYTNYFGVPAARYPLADGCPIFHPMDQVRVFMRDPFDPTRWYHHFCGFVSDMVDTFDHNNTKSLVIQVEDPTKLFRYTRIFQNPGILDAKKVITENDLQVQNFYQNFLKGYNLPEIFFTLIFGPDKAGNDKLLQVDTSKEPPSPYSTRIRGIGHFSYGASGIFMYGPDQDERRQTEQQGVTSRNGKFTPAKKMTTLLDERKPVVKIPDLATWQAIIDHEVFATDLWTMVPDHIGGDIVHKQVDAMRKDPNTPKSINGVIDTEAVIKFIGEHPEWYPVDGGRLLMLLPNSLGPDNRNIVEQDIIKTYNMNSDFHSAGTIMFKTIERIQFSMQCSPKGDIIIEFPLYDFDPDDFGMKEISEADLKSRLEALNTGIKSGTTSDSNTSIDMLNAMKHIPSSPRGPYGPRYVIRKDDTERVESSLIDSKVFTMGVGSPAIIQNYEGIGYTNKIGQVIPVTLTDLVPLYGVRQMPMITRGHIADEVAMTYYINTTLNRLNADAHTIKVEHLPALGIGINRPLYIEARNCLSTTKQVSHSISWPSSMATTTDLYATRIWDGTMSKDNPNVPIFMPLGGAGSRPLNYSMLFNKFKKPQTQSTVSTIRAKLHSDAASKISAKAEESIKINLDSVEETVNLFNFTHGKGRKE